MKIAKITNESIKTLLTNSTDDFLSFAYNKLFKCMERSGKHSLDWMRLAKGPPLDGQNVIAIVAQYFRLSRLANLLQLCQRKR